jgi:hypothetical protein
MIDERFSSNVFVSYDKEETKKLLGLLNKEIEQELVEVLRPHFLTIAKKLNSMGHSLKECESTKNCILYREDCSDTEGKEDEYKLHIAFDLVISTGYGHLYYSEIEDEEK